MATTEIDNLLGGLSLTPEEAEAPVVVADTAVEEVQVIKLRTLLARCFSVREVDVRGPRSAFVQSWGFNYKVIRLAKNLFQFVLPEQRDVTMVMDNGPWCFEGNLLVFGLWVDDWRQIEGFFDHTFFWVQLYGLGRHHVVPSIGRTLMVSFTHCIEGQIQEERHTQQLFFRFRIRVDVAQPLRRVLQVKIGMETIKAVIQYERLPNLCFSCGLVDHTINFCPTKKKELMAVVREKLPYNPQLLGANRRLELIEVLTMADGGNSHRLEHGDVPSTGLVAPLVAGVTLGTHLACLDPSSARLDFHVAVPNSVQSGMIGSARDDMASAQQWVVTPEFVFKAMSAMSKQVPSWKRMVRAQEPVTLLIKSHSVGTKRDVEMMDADGVGEPTIKRKRSEVQQESLLNAIVLAEPAAQARPV